MMEILIIGDTHIPSRAARLPPKIESHILNKKYSLILCTGDLVTRNVLRFFERLGDVRVVRGNMDFLPLPEVEVVSLGNVKVGLIHGHQVYPRGNVSKLTKVAIELEVNVLVSGHTHVPLVKEVRAPSGKVYLLNPGSATGVWSGGGGSLIPSFMECVVTGSSLKVTCYELRTGTLIRSQHNLIL